MRVSWSPRALAQLDAIAAYVAQDNPAAAARIVSRIRETARSLGQFPGMGHPTDEADVRLKVVRGYPYLVFYKVLADRDEVHILRVRHARQRPLTSAS